VNWSGHVRRWKANWWKHSRGLLQFTRVC
jgi:hypothetical protein